MYKILIIILICTFLFVNCSHKKGKTKNKGNANISKQEVPTLFLPDSLFGLKDISKVDLINAVKYIDNRLYSDSIKSIEFIKLNEEYKDKILVIVCRLRFILVKFFKCGQ